MEILAIATVSTVSTREAVGELSQAAISRDALQYKRRRTFAFITLKLPIFKYGSLFEYLIISSCFD